jgi:HEPN domain-containing protein
MEAKFLTDYASGTRYPGDYDPVTKTEYREVLKVASTVLKWAKSIIEKKQDELF